MDTDNRKLRSIPAIDRLLAANTMEPELNQYPRQLVIACLRQAVANVRQALLGGTAVEVSPEALVADARRLLAKQVNPSLRRVINATGVVLHTNLGRAPLGSRARARVAEVMDGYSTLEYNVDSGERGSRYSHVVDRLRWLTGSEDALVVNNNAAAVLLVLSSVAKGQEVIVSRGELVEIGGSFRIPDVMKQSGAVLVEVGTTNKTHLSDYEQAISPNTAALLKVHTSNYRIIGFTAQPDSADLAALANKYELPLIEDLGSGTLVSLHVGGQQEPTVTERLAQGFDIVTFSADKLLGAGQGGVIAGKTQYIEVMKKHPLLRAIRIDKLSLAALEGTLHTYMLGDASSEIPVLAMLNAPEDELLDRAGRLQALIRQHDCLGSLTSEIVPLVSPAGGGSLPSAILPGYGVAVSVTGISASFMESRLRQRAVPIIARVQQEKIIFDVRCITDNNAAEIAEALVALSKPGRD